MDENDVFDDLEPSDTQGFADLCPSCGVIPGVSGPSIGCQDPEGCGAYAGPEEEEEDLEEDWDEEEEYEDEYEDDEYDDEELEELDFDGD